MESGNTPAPSPLLTFKIGCYLSAEAIDSQM